MCLFQVEVRRRRRRPEDAEIGELYPNRVADQERPGLLVEDRVVMLRVAG